MMDQALADSEKKRKKVSKKSYSSYIANLFIVLKQVHPDRGIFLMNFPSMLSLRVQVGHKYIA
jgi:hypothetical protein